MTRSRRLAALMLACLAGRPALAQQDFRGFQLAAGCAACHGAQTPGSIVPALAGRDAAGIARALRAYQSGERRSQIMQVVAASLSPEEIDIVARTLSAQPGPAR